MAQLLNSDQINRYLIEFPDWLLRDRYVERTFRFKNFAEALTFVNRVGELAEATNHHPDIDIRWNQVRLELTTHSAGGLTELDFALARQIQGL